MTMTAKRRKELITDYNNGEGPGNIDLAIKYGITNSQVRNILIEAGVYKPQRSTYNVPRNSQELIAILRYENKKYKEVLEKIANWELPDSGEFWDEKRKEKKSYTVAFGWEGVKKYFQKIASEVLQSGN